MENETLDHRHHGKYIKLEITVQKHKCFTMNHEIMSSCHNFMELYA